VLGCGLHKRVCEEQSLKIYPSLISGDLLRLGATIEKITNHCDGFHIDVMDDHFVPNLTWGPAFVQAISEKTKLPIHLHLMVDESEKWLDRVQLKKDDIFIFHVEAVAGWQENKVVDFIKKIKELGCKVGVAINPKTPIESVSLFIKQLDHVLLMSVEPGFSGQKFMPEVLEKVAPLQKLREQFSLSFAIGMDGGINFETIKAVAQAGVEQVGVASAIFNRGDPVAALQKLYEIVD